MIKERLNSSLFDSRLNDVENERLKDNTDENYQSIAYSDDYASILWPQSYARSRNPLLVALVFHDSRSGQHLKRHRVMMSRSTYGVKFTVSMIRSLIKE